MPSLLLTNANRICNKLDDLSVLVQAHNPTLIAVTESWLDDSIPDSAISLRSFSVLRRDRQGQPGGGVLLYVNNSIMSRRLTDLVDNDCSSEFEILWALLRPHFLPRSTSVLIISIVYCPPWYSATMNCNLCHY